MLKIFNAYLFLAAFCVAAISSASAQDLVMAGSCSGEGGIDSLRFDGPNCLSVKANNCNGGVLEVQSTCKEDLHLGDFIILGTDSYEFYQDYQDGMFKYKTTTPLGERVVVGKYATIELFRDIWWLGTVKARKANGNVASYKPFIVDDILEINGIVGDHPVVLSYRKTHKDVPKFDSNVFKLEGLDSAPVSGQEKN
jgi:hypothetical protein